MIHIYWHTEPDAKLQARAERWRVLNGVDVKVWTPETVGDVVAGAEATIDAVLERDRVRHIANIVRWTLLAEHGGMWADADVTPLKPFPPYEGVGSLLEPPRPWCAAIGAAPTPFVCGGPAGHPLWGRVLDEALDEPYGSSASASGGALLARVVAPHELALVPTDLFAEHDARGQRLTPIPGGRLADHAWATASRRHQGMRQ